MATELGKAYVQIIPSAKGISGSISNLMSGEADSAGKSAGGILGGNLVGMMTKVFAAAGIGKAISSTLMEGANLQQSLGGIETLFKDDANKVKEYATNAYKTAGLSANDYMETVTSFSASLLQSMGGDTAAAADVANMALIDMSDNANKFGTSMGSIQDAYKGFAKQNYTMLDNLSLGYGGTKTEMERLLADATALSGVEYNIDNLDDVYNAINVIQTEMGVTGTTALESAETFSGAMASMKASLSNVMGNMAIGEDIKPALEALAQTTSTFLFQNLFPMLGNILSALPTMIVTFIQAAIPHVMEAGSNLMKSFGDAIMSVIPDALKPLTKQFTNLGKSAGKGLNILTDGVKDVWTTVTGFLSGLDWTAFLAGVQTAVSASIQFFQPWVDFIKNKITIMLDLYAGLWDSIKQGLNGDWAGGLETLKQTFVSAFTGLVENVIGKFTGMWKNVKSLMTSIDWGAAATTLMTMLGTAISGAISFLGDIGTAIKDWVFTSLGVTSWTEVGTKIGEMLNTSIISAIGLLTTIGTSIKDWVFNALAVSDWTSVGTKIGELIVSALGLLVDFGTSVATTLWNFVTTGFSSDTESGNSVASMMIDGIVAGVTALAEVVAGIATTIWEWITTAFSEVDWTGIGTNIVDGIKAGISNAWGTFTSWVSEKAAGIKNMFNIPLDSHSPSRVMRDEVGQWIPAGIGAGISEGMHFITGAISSVTDQIGNTTIPMPKLASITDFNTGSLSSATAQLSTRSDVVMSDTRSKAPTTEELIDMMRENMQITVEGDAILDNEIVGTIMMRRTSREMGKRTSKSLRGLAIG